SKASNATINKATGRVTIWDGAPSVASSTSLANTISKAEVFINQKFSVKVSPNPSAYYFTLITKSSSNNPVIVRVTDMVGRIVEMRSNVSANNSLRIGENYRTGIYLIEVIQGQERKSFKLIKQSN
ncbi:MAG: T9SS type A sorting domain-containing protein, partial [Saprospiraceae bacterium]